MDKAYYAETSLLAQHMAAAQYLRRVFNYYRVERKSVADKISKINKQVEMND